MADYFVVEDKIGRTIVCTHERWFQHIIRNHPELEHQESEVIKAIQKPLGIFIDADFSNRNVYYFKPGRLGRYIKVIVEFRETNYGEVKSAFYTDNTKRGEILKWMK